MWDSMALVYFVKHGPTVLVWLFSKLLALLLFNRFVLWFGGGVPAKQYALIRQDGIPIEQYLGRTVDGEPHWLHVASKHKPEASTNNLQTAKVRQVVLPCAGPAE